MPFLSPNSSSTELAAFIESRIIIGMTHCEPIYEIAHNIAEHVTFTRGTRQCTGASADSKPTSIRD